jgi:hypothetical protein
MCSALPSSAYSCSRRRNPVSGDQLARVALALLVCDRTSSAALTALVHAATYLPPLLSAPWVTGIADRYPRRTVMVTTDLARAVLVALTAIPELPLPAVVVLLVAMSCPQPLFSGARTRPTRRSSPVIVSRSAWRV